MNNTFSKAFHRMYTAAPILTISLALLFIAELAVIFLFPWIIPEKWYLYWYLPPKARESTFEFLNDQKPFLEYDPHLGWRNRPNAGRKHWQIDEHGSRSTQSFTLESDKKMRFVFLGNSLINGGTHVANQETISAFMADSLIETINFGTMMYSLDQVVLAYEKQFQHYKADVLVVGLSGRPCGGLVNHYIPFRKRNETNLPYVKPRFGLNAGELHYHRMPSKTLHRQLFENMAFLNHLKDTDDYYNQFSRYKRLGILPFSSMLWEAFRKYHHLKWYFQDQARQFHLLKKLMNRLEKTAHAHQTKVLFLILPDLNMTSPSMIRSLLPDRYQSLIDFLQKHQFNILDMRHAFRNSGKAIESFYADDAVHYSVAGNRFIAKTLKAQLIQWQWLDN